MCRQKILPGTKDNYTYYYARLVVKGGITFDNYTIYPMVIPAGCTDETYKPYVKNNEQLQEEINVINNYMGSKNIFDYTKWSKTDYKSGAGTCVDGEYTITVPADYENNSGIYLTPPTGFGSKYNFEEVKISLDIKGDDAFYVNLGFGSSAFINSYPVSTEWERVSGISNFPGNSLTLYIRSTTATGSLPHTLYIRNIMITPSVDDDVTYQPYAMTNRELTEKVAISESIITNTTSITSSNATLVRATERKVGNTITMTIVFTTSAEISAGSNIDITIARTDIKGMPVTMAIYGTTIFACTSNDLTSGTLRIRPMNDTVPTNTTIYATFMGLL